MNVFDLHRMVQAIDARQALLQTHFGRVFSELDRWIRLQRYQQATGLSKEAVALLFLNKDVGKLSDAFAEVQASFLKLQAMGQISTGAPPRRKRNGKRR
jgi:hypothetical protein